MPFNVCDFISDPAGKLITLPQAKKVDLQSLAEKLGIPLSSTALKSQILDLVLSHYVEEDILSEEQVADFRPRSSNVDREIELAKIHLKLEEAKRQNAEYLSRKRIEERKSILDLEYEERKSILDLEYQSKIKEAEISKALEEEKAKISVQKHKDEVACNVVPFDLSKARKLVPFFDESDVESFFISFEDVAGSLEWPADQWLFLIKPQLRGKAIQVVSSLVGKGYDVIKQGILDAYTVTSEGYRQLFRNATKTVNQTFTEFANHKLRLFKKWLAKEEVTEFSELVNLMVLEEFHRRLPPAISVYLAEKEVKDLAKAGNLADNYNLIHKCKYLVNPSDKPNDKQSFSQLSSSVCAYCKQPGHSIRDCPKPKCKISKQPQSNVFAAKKPNLHYVVPETDPFKDFYCNGFVNNKQVNILRDTGAAQTVVRKELVSKVDMLDENIVVTDLSTSKVLPLAEVNIDCPYVKDKVKVAVCDKELPVSKVDIVLGNDLAGSKVISNLIICNPESRNVKTNCNPDNVVEVKSTEIGDEGKQACIVTRSGKSTDVGKPSKATVSEKNLPDILSLTRENFAKLQREDKTISYLFEKAVNKSEIDKVPCYYIDNDVLMRLYRSPKLSSDDSWANQEQLIVPKSLRSKILEIAHCAESHLGISKTYQRLSSEFYWPAMKQEVKEFVKCCHVCQVVGNPNEVIPPAPLRPIAVPKEPFMKVVIDCVGPLPKTRKGNQYLLTVMCPTTRYPIAIPIRNISAKVIVEKLLSLFTMFGFPRELQCDRGTNFQSGVFQSVLKELNIQNSFSSAYRPQSQGVLERSHQTMKNLLRKFTMDTDKDWDECIDLLLFVMRSVPNESTGVSPFEMLFGRKARDILKIIKENFIEDSNAEKTVTISQYLANMKDRFDKVHKFASSNLVISQQRMKFYYDRKSKVRHFQVGDNVLVYFPVQGAPLQHKFSGPYRIIKVVNKLNYVISTPDRRKSSQLVHVNLIKPYHGKSIPVLANQPVQEDRKCVQTRKQTDDDQTEFEVSWADCSNSEIISSLAKYLDYLPRKQRLELTELLLNHSNVCDDEPGHCRIISHDIKLLPGTTPIRQSYYRIIGEKLELMKKEVKYLLENNLASPSCSAWASPCILVPKPNGKVRMCTDFRRVNAVTQKDSYPLPRITDILDNIGNSKYLTQIDLLKGYYQIDLTEEAREISAFITPFGLFQYNVLAFGMCNAPATFQRVINELTRDLDDVYAYLDDIVIATDTWEKHLLCLEALLKRLQAYNLKINLSKSSFGKAKVMYLGHLIGSGSVMPKDINVQAIKAYPVPSNRKQLQTFLGMSAYYSRFCRNFAIVAKPLYALTSAKVRYVWTNECQEAFVQLKTMLTSFPILKSPDIYKPFFLQVDACSTGVGAVLLQPNCEIEEPDLTALLPVAYFSRKFNETQQRWSTVEQELYAIVASLLHFSTYLRGHHPVTVLTDHMPLSFLERAKLHNKKLLRWSFILQEYNLKIKHIPGKSNILADALSRT